MSEFNITKKSLNLINKVNVGIYSKIAKNHSVYREKLVSYVFDVHENLVTANVFTGTTRIRHQKLVLSKLYQLDMLLGLLNDLSIIDNKEFMGTINILNDLRKMLIGWIKSEETKK